MKKSRSAFAGQSRQDQLGSNSSRTTQIVDHFQEAYGFLRYLKFQNILKINYLLYSKYITNKIEDQLRIIKVISELFVVSI